MKKQPIFYGWWIVVALFAVGMVAPLARGNMSAFLPFVLLETDWTREAIGLAQSLALWLYGPFVLLSGTMLDRIGSRKTFLIGGAVTVLGWVLLSTAQSPWQLYLYYGVILALAVAMTHYVPLLATTRKWFIKRAGVVGGITASAWAVGHAIFLPAMTELAASHGWRYTSWVLGVCFGALIMICAVFIIRDTPESMGLRPDGEGAPPPDDDPAAVEVSWDIKSALRTSQFALLFIAYSIYNIGLNGLVFHVVAWGVDLGSPEATAGIFATAFAVPMVIGTIAGGWLGDKYGKTRVMPIGLGLATAAMFYGWLGVATQEGLVALAIGVGIGTGLQVSLYVPLLGDFFGRARVGSLWGILCFGYGLIGGWGPLLWAMLRESTGNYNTAALISAVCYAIGAVVLLFVRPTRGED
jgi:MFS family permease